jgi:hypothetical protein
MTFQPADPETAQAIREHIARMRGERQESRVECPYCNATAKAIREVQARWVVAGMDKGE